MFDRRRRGSQARHSDGVESLVFLSKARRKRRHLSELQPATPGTQELAAAAVSNRWSPCLPSTKGSTSGPSPGPRRTRTAAQMASRPMAGAFVTRQASVQLERRVFGVLNYCVLLVGDTTPHSSSHHHACGETAMHPSYPDWSSLNAVDREPIGCLACEARGGRRFSSAPCSGWGRAMLTHHVPITGGPLDPSHSIFCAHPTGESFMALHTLLLLRVLPWSKSICPARLHIRLMIACTPTAWYIFRAKMRTPQGS